MVPPLMWSTEVHMKFVVAVCRADVQTGSIDSFTVVAESLLTCSCLGMVSKNLEWLEAHFLFTHWLLMEGLSLPPDTNLVLEYCCSLSSASFLRHRVAKNGADEVPYVTVVSLYSWTGLSVEYLHKILCKSLSCGWTTIWRYILTISAMKHTWWVLNCNTMEYKSGWTVAPTWSMSFSDNPFEVLALPSKTTLVFVVELVSLKTGWWGRK